MTFTCNESNRAWIIGSPTIRRGDDELPDGLMADGRMLIVSESANNTLYGCAIVSRGEFIIDTGILYLAGKFNAQHQHPEITFLTVCMILCSSYGDIGFLAQKYHPKNSLTFIF